MKSDLVSIIVPVFNVEKYLSNCVNSILSQTYKSIEVILINDGSTDNSGMICDKFANKDSRIKVIHQKNAGVSASRNLGINIAIGKYIQFVDSDDTIEADMTEKLMRHITKQDQLVMCGYKHIYKYNHIIYTNSHLCPVHGRYSKNEFLLHFEEFFKKNNYIAAVWNKLYSSELIKKYNLSFIEGLNLGEDTIFNLDYIERSESIIIIRDVLYNYYGLDEFSLSRGYREGLFKNRQIEYSKVRRFLKEYDMYKDKTKDCVEELFTDSILECLENISHGSSKLTSQNRKNHISEIVNNDCIRNNIIYLINGNTEKQIVGIMIKCRLNEVIHQYFKFKIFLRNKSKMTFRVLGKGNYKKPITY